MNEKRKLFQNKDALKNQKAITLIALVISIIVMLILAGVSLNATIGENGIMTQAKNATYMQGIATLEEYLQSEYVKHYDEADNYTSKVELLVNKISNLCLKDGTKNYITYDGKMYYLLNKQALPEEIRNQLRGGDTTDYLSYIRLKDVYGITEDLRVYYCSEGTDNVLGTLNTSELNPNTPLVKVNTDNEIKSAISDALATVGVEVGENGVTVGDASKIKDLELDGSKYNITSISALSEISTLKTLTLSNLTLDNLDGLENCTLLNGIYFKNCKINNYTKISTAWNLQYLYLYLPPTMSEADANAQVEKLGEGLANATEIKNLEYFGISGTTAMFDGKYTSDTNNTSKINYTDVKKYSKLSNIDNLDKFSNNLKQSIKYLYLNNNSFKSINSLKDFKNLNEADLMCNINLENLDGLENSTNLVYLCAQYCNLKNIVGITGSINLRTATFDGNLNLESLTGLEDSKNLDFLTAWKCNINDVTALKDNMKLRYLSLANNINLQNIIALKNCTGIKKLYLSGNENMIGTEVRDALADETTHVLQNCGPNYSLPTKYYIYVLNSTESIDYSYEKIGKYLTDDSDEMLALKGKTKIKKINLKGQKNISNTIIQEILQTLTNLEAISLNGCTNLSSLDFLKYINEVKELDLRNTSVRDYTILNTREPNLITLVINITNEGYEKDNSEYFSLASIESCIIKILDNFEDEVSFENSNLSETCREYRGFLPAKGLDFSVLTKLKFWKAGCANNEFYLNGGEIIDLSNCTELTSVTYWNGDQCSWKLPTNIETFSPGQGVINNVDLSLCRNLKKIRMRTALPEEFNRILNTLPSENSLEEIYVYLAYNWENLQWLKCEKTKNIKNLSIFGYSTTDITNLKSLSGIENCPKLVNVSFNSTHLNSLKELVNCQYLQYIDINTTDVESLQGIETLNNLQTLVANNCKIYDISAIQKCTKIEKIYLNNNKISNIDSIGNLKNITKLQLNDNNIENLLPLENLIENGKIKFTQLNLSNNLLQTTTVTGHNNIETLVKLYNAGLRTLNISGNNFTAGSTDRLKNLSWTSYTE